MSHYWLIKSEPSVFSIDDMKEKKIEPWDGVRNYQARNNMMAMKKNDLCFFYHSNTKNAGIVGIVEVYKESYPDPENNTFVLVDMLYKKHTKLLSLTDLRKIEAIAHLPLFHQSRLSVQPVDLNAANVILHQLEI